MQQRLEQLYHHLPVPLQNLGITLFGIHWYNRRFGGIFKAEYAKCKERQFYTTEEWKSYQETELRKLLLHANETVPYYRTLFANIGKSTNDLSHFQLSDLNTLPYLSKDTFRRIGTSELVSSKLEPSSRYLSSSGSTGTPTKTLYSLAMHQKYFAIFEVCINNWAGIDYKMPRGVIGGRRVVNDPFSKGPYYRYNYIEKQAYFSAYHISKSTVANYIEGIKKHKLEYMTGYASSNYFLARFIEELGLEVPKMRAVLTSSEKLTPEMRETFKRVYKCETFDSYNGVECCNLISECEHHRLHIVPDVGIVEVVNNDGSPTKPGCIGELISTGLLNFNQPLIRYRMGDLVRLSEQTSCPCGRAMPIVDEIIGRVEDEIVGPDGRVMVRFHSVFYNINDIVESQVIQHSLMDYEIKLVTMNGNLQPSELDTIRKKFISQLGNVNLKINFVDTIPKGSNGKYKSVISMITN